MARTIFQPLLDNLGILIAIGTLLGVGIGAVVVSFLYGDWEDG